jgi:hypothetical protein
MIYTIDRDLSHMPTFLSRGDRTHDARLIYFDGWVDAGFENPEIDLSGRVPPVIEFVGDLDVLEWSDFPYVAPTRLLMSKKMLNVLLAVQSFKCQIYPTLIYSYKIEELVRYSFDGTRTGYHVEDPSLFTDKFIIMQLAESTYVVDEDKTIIEGKTARESDLWYLSELDVEHYEFTKEEKDLPPVFATPKTPYFYTEAAVRALEVNNIRGVEFHPIPQHFITSKHR